MVTAARLLGALPLALLRTVGAGLGLAAWMLSPGYRSKLRANLRVAGYASIADAARAAAEAGRMVGELPFVWRRAPAELARHVVCDDLSVLDSAEARGRGILFLTPHLGAFEVAARFYASRAPVTVLFKPPRKAWLRPLVAFSRRAQGVRAVPVSLGGVRALVRALRAGEAVAVLPDQVPEAGDGRWAPFFGRPAWTMTLPQRLAEQPGVRVVLVVSERLRGARGWRVHLEPMDETPTPEALNARMEVLIRRHPAQYLWGYNRYKRPAAAGTPD
ncbi:MAG: lysophospholipid acyltransferase family protein [Burkholderiales bacterium]|nr:MAG: lysophospholipid acyltransferase family protein [Burkholderiales bacterium]